LLGKISLILQELQSMKIKQAPKKPEDAEEGSAILEFLILAIPLFVPLIIYLTSLNQSAQIEYEARNFARALARAYVTSPSQELTAPRIQAVTSAFAANSFILNKIDSPPKVQISCSANPCLTPDGKIEVTVILSSSSSKKVASAKATQTVDAWRDS